VTVYLLDINVLLALTDPMHIHHESARRWFGQKGRQAWATCPITENGFIRIASHPNYPNRPGDVSAVLAVLRRLCDTPGHHFWPEDISIRQMLDGNTVVSPGHITDAYLLGLAIQKHGKLATLDRGIPVHAVKNGNEAIELVSTANTK
jgi:toxin-antitoxin system PIN domain toxin